MGRAYYGAIARGCSGSETFLCGSRACADRVRRVLRAYEAAGCFAGARTLGALVDLAAQRAGVRAARIVAEFRAKGKAMRLTEMRAEIPDLLGPEDELTKEEAALAALPV